MNNHLMRFAILPIAAALCACAVPPPGAPGYDEAAARDEIWAKEQAVYEARGRGDVSVYINSSSERYLGWPPGWETPSGLDTLRAGASLMEGMDQEELTMAFENITFSGNTAIIYYSTHRTRLPSGEEVDQRFDICHIWAREEAEWKLLGALGRTKLIPPEVG